MLRSAAGVAALLASLLGLALAAPFAAADVVDDDPAAVSRGPGDVVVFARGTDGAIHYRVGLGGTWASMGGQATSGPAAAVRPDGTIDVFARGASETIEHATFSKAGVGAWRTVGGARSLTGPGAVQRRGRTHTDLFYVDPSRSLTHRSRPNPTSGWSGADSLGPAIASAPGPVSRLDNWLDVYVRNTDNGVFNKSYAAQGPWKAYDDVAGQVLGGPDAITRGSGNINLFVRGLDSYLYTRTFTQGSGYGAWSAVDARAITSGPGAVADGGSRMHVFAFGGRDLLVKTYDDAAGWGAWRSLGPVQPPPAAPAPQPPAPAPAPVAGGSVSFEAGLSCTPQGGRVPVTVAVRKRPGRAKPRVRRVVFYYRLSRRTRVIRTDRKAPYRRTLPVRLKPGTHRVYARIEYRRGSKRGRKTVSRRFAVCG